jgi:hypothetical protein
MSVGSLPLLPHLYQCQSPIYADTRWDARPQHNRRGNAGDLEWLEKPLQAPYYETDTKLMSYDLSMWKDKQGDFRPEVLSDPCYPTPTKYCSFGHPVWVYDTEYPSLSLPTKPCSTWRGQTGVPDVACLDQQDLMSRDRLALMKSVI